MPIIGQGKMDSGRVDDEGVATTDLEGTIGWRVAKLDKRTSVESFDAGNEVERDVDCIFKQGRRRG